MVLLEAIAAGSLAPLRSQPDLQRLVVYVMLGIMVAMAVLVFFLIVWFARTRPGLLFNPQDIDKSVHYALYGTADQPRPPDTDQGLWVVLDDALGQQDEEP